MQTFGGPSRKVNQKKCFFYSGPEKRQRLTDEIPTFEKLTHNRILCEQRFFITNTNGKWITLGIIPSSKLLGEDAAGFHFETFLCGEGKPSLPLGGIEGIASLLSTIREIPEFTKVVPSTHGITPNENITISTVEFAGDVRFLLYLLFTFSI